MYFRRYNEVNFFFITNWSHLNIMTMKKRKQVYKRDLKYKFMHVRLLQQKNKCLSLRFPSIFT